MLARSAVNARQIGRLVGGLHAAGLDAREIEQRVDQLQQAQAVAVREFRGSRAARPAASRRSAERVFQRAQHQRQRRAELVADVGEERGLGAVDLGQRFGALALLLVGARVGDAGRDLSRQQAEEAAIVVVERPVRIQAGDKETGDAALACSRQRHDDRAVRRRGPRRRSADRAKRDARSSISSGAFAVLACASGQMASASGQVDRRRRGQVVRSRCRPGATRRAARPSSSVR